MCSYHLAIFLSQDYKFLMKFLICFNFSVIFLAFLPLPLQKKIKGFSGISLPLLCDVSYSRISSIFYTSLHKIQTNKRKTLSHILCQNPNPGLLPFLLCLHPEHILSYHWWLFGLRYHTVGRQSYLLSKGQHKKTFGFLKA